MSIDKSHSRRLSPGAHSRSSHRFLALITVASWVLISGSGLTSNPKVVGYYHAIHAALIPGNLM